MLIARSRAEIFAERNPPPPQIPSNCDIPDARVPVHRSEELHLHYHTVRVTMWLQALLDRKLDIDHPHIAAGIQEAACGASIQNRDVFHRFTQTVMAHSGIEEINTPEAIIAPEDATLPTDRILVAA